MKKIIVCSAFLQEVRPLLTFFKARPLYDLKKPYRIYSCVIRDIPVDFVICGMGRKNTARYLKEYIRRFQPDRRCLWILTGYCGGVAPFVQAGDAVLPFLVTDASGEEAVPQNRYVPFFKKQALFSSPRVMGKKEKEVLYGKDRRVVAVDMESGAFIRVMKENGYGNFFIYKVVIEDRDFVFPDRGFFRKPVRTVLKRIGQLPAVLVLHWRMTRASRMILRYLRAFFSRMKFPTDRS